MYLTKIVLSNSEAIQQHLFNPYQWHIALWKCFQAKVRPYLFRVDQDRDQMIFLMSSSIQPFVQPWGTWQIKMVPPNFYNHNQYIFSLRAYPAIKKVIFDENGDRKKQGIRLPHAEPEAWITRKAVKNGFEIKNVIVAKKKRQNTSKGFQMAVDFEGVLTVKDRTLFLDALNKGIGPSKAYGMGMLLLKPL
jgi:CRISPR-associated protein Cas6/Cse3/CasE, subtype I-E/ECOLI